jgi:hypothetical protein
LTTFNGGRFRKMECEFLKANPMKYSLRSLMIVVAVGPPLLAAAYFLALLAWPAKWNVLAAVVSVLFLGALVRLLGLIHHSNRDKI